MRAERLRISKESAVRVTALTTVFIAASSAGVLIAREVSERRIRSINKDNQNSGDSGIDFLSLERASR